MLSYSGIEDIGVSLNMFDAELKHRILALNKRWVKDSSTSLFARKYRIPGVLNILDGQKMRDTARFVCTRHGQNLPRRKKKISESTIFSGPIN